MARKAAGSPAREPRILITNDDGYSAPGIRALERIARALSKDIWVVAPEVEQSATSHSLTLRRPLRVRKQKARHFTVDGTPTDCVLVASENILKDRRPDIVLSGINMGSNLGEDVTYSGTVAAAMEAALLGMKAIAFSQVRDGEGRLDFEAAEAHGPKLVQRLLAAKWHREVLMNVNFPALPAKAVRGIRVCRQGRRESGTTVAEGRDPSGRPYVWIGQFLSDDTPEHDTDLKAVIEGMISVTPLHLDLTHGTTLRELGELFPERR
jgi:5'-nucleotidase